jgi:uncharacterized damage-inducible protein DinB
MFARTMHHAQCITKMVRPSLIEFYERDLRRLKDELNLYSNESDLWVVKNGISNSGGNLCLHLLGNLNHFIGATLGKSGYVRDRDSEFTLKNIPRAELNTRIDQTIEVVKSALENLSSEDFYADYPLLYNGNILKTQNMLLHLLSHLNYHLGQINYHRRLVGNHLVN